MSKTGVRRTIVQEWMSFAGEKRQFKEQVAAFARNAAHSRFCHLAFSCTQLPPRQQPHGFRDVEYSGDRRFLCLAHA